MYEEETEKAKQEFMYLHSSKVKQSSSHVTCCSSDVEVIGAGGGAAGAAEQGEEQQFQHRGRDEGGLDLLSILSKFGSNMIRVSNNM